MDKTVRWVIKNWAAGSAIILPYSGATKGKSDDENVVNLDYMSSRRDYERVNRPKPITEVRILHQLTRFA